MTLYVGSDKIKDTGEYGVYLGSQNTNCLTKTPKNVNLTLSNGTLTLKKGSKVYVPNGKNTDGSNKFDTVTIASDLTLTNSFIGTYDNIAVTLRTDTNSIIGDVMSTRWCSGETDTLSSLTGTHFWYDTTSNIVKLMQGTTQITTCSFPICLMGNIGGEGFKYINQTFDWCGYIGSTAFVLPGVKGLIPNGFNADGTYKSVEYTVPRVLTGYHGGQINATLTVDIGRDYLSFWNISYVHTVSSLPAISSTDYSKCYLTTENKQYYHNGTEFDGWREFYEIMPNTRMVTDSNGKITSLTPYTAQPETIAMPINAIYNGSEKVYQYNSYQPSTVLVSQAGDNTSRTIKLRKGVYEIVVTGGGGFGKYGWYNAIFHGQGGSGSSIYGQIYVPEDTTITYYAGTDNESASSSAYGYSSYIAVSGTQILTAGGGQSGWDLGNNGAGGTTTNNISASKIQNISLTFKNGVAGGSGGTSVDPNGISGEGGRATGTTSDRGEVGRVYIKYVRYNK